METLDRILILNKFVKLSQILDNMCLVKGLVRCNYSMSMLIRNTCIQKSRFWPFNQTILHLSTPLKTELSSKTYCTQKTPFVALITVFSTEECNLPLLIEFPRAIIRFRFSRSSSNVPRGNSYVASVTGLHLDMDLCTFCDTTTVISVFPATCVGFLDQSSGRWKGLTCYFRCSSHALYIL